MLQGKFSKLNDAKILPCGCFFIDALTSTTISNLQTQKSDISIIDFVDCLDATKWNYKKPIKTIWKRQK